MHVENTVTLKGHASRVRSILWSRDDMKIFTTSQDGSLFAWDILAGAIVHEVILRGAIFTSLALTPDSETVYAVTSDGVLKEIVHGRTTRELVCPESLLTTVSLSTTAHCLLFGTQEGVLRMVTYPLVPEGTYLATI